MEEKKQRIVVKVGTSTLTRENGSLKLHTIDRLAQVLSDLKGMGHEVILVSSGAIGIGTGKLGLKERPKELRFKQAVAAVGQCEMMHLYDKFFGEYGKTVAQILLTGDDVDSPEIKQSLINTFNSLLSLGIVPVVNENDSVSSAEIERHSGEHKVFGDNDTLSAVVAVLTKADKLILLSDIDGLYDANPIDDPNARIIREVRVIDDELRALAGGAGSSRGTGGMITKLQAAELATANGIDMIIADGSKPELLYDIVEGKPVGTLLAKRRCGND